MMSNELVVSAISPIVTALFMGGLLWIKRRIEARLDEGKTETLDAVAAVDKKFDTMDEKVSNHMRQTAEHQEADTALFSNLGERVARVEGAADTLTKISGASVEGLFKLLGKEGKE